MVVSSPHEPAHAELPAVDDRLVAPESGFEIDDGELVEVPPADEPHAINHGALAALLWAHRARDRMVAIDMLTRTSRTSDIAPDASIYPAARDPRTGGRLLEEIAFEVLSSQRRGNAGSKAAKLVARGVRRVFGLDIVRRRAFEWSREIGDWMLLASDGRIEDPALVVPLPVPALLDAAIADDAAVRAYRAQRHPEFLAEREEGRHDALRDALRTVLASKFGALDADAEERLSVADADELRRALERAVHVASLADVWA